MGLGCVSAGLPLTAEGSGVNPSDDIWLPRIGRRAIRQRALGNRIIFIEILLGAGLAVFALLKMANAFPPALLGAMRVYIGIFMAYGILMIPCGWLPMYLAAGRSAARFLGPERTARKRIPIIWLRDPAFFDRAVTRESVEGAPPVPYPQIPDPRHDALVAKFKERQEQRRQRNSG